MKRQRQTRLRRDQKPATLWPHAVGSEEANVSGERKVCSGCKYIICSCDAVTPCDKPSTELIRNSYGERPVKWEEMRPGVMLRWKDGDYIYTVDGNGEQPYTFALRYGVDGSSRASKEYIEAGLWFLAVKKTQ